ncbi:MAG: phosphatase PAP2 family protein [Pseudomonadota bacterium]
MDAVFPRSYWNKRFRSFVNLSNVDPAWKSLIKLQKPPQDQIEVDRELDDLMQKKLTGREERLSEILYEADALTKDFSRALVMNDVSHPATAEVIDAIVIAGRLAHFHYKEQFQRPRPSQLRPDIAPVIDVPEHPAYPSGHANQHFMIAMALTEFAPQYQQRLFDIATRVSENREYAGVHFKSDTEAGKDLARQFFPFVRKAYAEEFDRARKEWPSPSPSP